MTMEREFGMGLMMVLPAAEVVADLTDLLPVALSEVMPISSDIGGVTAWNEYVTIRMEDSMCDLHHHIDYCLIRALSEHLHLTVSLFMPQRVSGFGGFRNTRRDMVDPVALKLYELARPTLKAYMESFGEIDESLFADGENEKMPTLSFVRLKAGIYLIPTAINFPESDLVVSASAIQNAAPPKKERPIKKIGENVIAFPKKKVKPKPPPKKPK